MMNSLLQSVLVQQLHYDMSGITDTLTWQYLAEGVYCFTPLESYKKTIVISAGIHGNETAPIELLEYLYQALICGHLTLRVRLLLVLGHPEAIRQGKRYIDYDMNRLFQGSLSDSFYEYQVATLEYKGVVELERIVGQFFSESPNATGYHLDLHTAIRHSLLPTFALLPKQLKPYDTWLLNSLNAAELDALVYHKTQGYSFTQFSCNSCHAASATLELGQAKALGQNDLTQFTAIHQMLCAFICEHTLPIRQMPPMRCFQVTDVLIKNSNDLQLNLAASAPNFSLFCRGEVIASQQGIDYVAKDDPTYILFPNAQVQLHLRAGLLLREIDTAQ